MSELKIPEAAYTAGADAYVEADSDGGWLEAIDAAAPLVVAAELRQLADELDRRADIVPINTDGGSQRTGLLNAADIARTKANELDPQGLTTYYKE